MLDTIIIGSGPGGVSAAIYLKRAGLNVSVFTTNNSALLKADKIENYYGVETIDGKSLYNLGLIQLEKLEIPLYKEEVVNIEWGDVFTIETNNSIYQAKTVIIATGISRTPLKIKNLDKFEGKGISYCATCDGFFYKNKRLGLIGNGNLAIHELNYLKDLTDDLTVFTNGEEIVEEIEKLSLPVINDKIIEIKGNDKLEEIVLENNKTISLDGLFIAVGLSSGISFAKRLGLETNNNFLVVNDKYETNISGIYAIGDIVSKNMQVSKAVNDGYLVSKEITTFLKSK